MRYAVLLISMLLLAALCAGQESNINTFKDFEIQVNELEKNAEYDQAIQLTRTVWSQFPNREFDLMKEMIYLNFKTGRYDDNLQIWAEGQAKGYFFLLNTRMKKYEPYINNEFFFDLVRTDEALRQASFMESETVYEIELPDTITPSRKYPLMIILHGGGRNMEKMRESWKIIPAMKSDFIITFVQSYRHLDYNTFGWTSSDERAYNDLMDIFTEIVAKYPVDTSCVILCGISAGGTMAFDIALNNILTVSGVIAFCPGKPRKIDPDALDQCSFKIFMLGGEFDYYLPRQEEMARLFKEFNILYHYKIITGMHHEFPMDYELQMNEGIAFLLNAEG